MIRFTKKKEDFISNGKARAITKKRLGLDEEGAPPDEMKIIILDGPVTEYITYRIYRTIESRYAEYKSTDYTKQTLFLLPRLPYKDNN